jgi:hypothetical protein
VTIREDYQALTEKQLNAWKAQTEQFRADAIHIEAQARLEYNHALARLHAKQKEAWDNFDRMKNASGSAWEELKSGMDKAGAELREAAERMTMKFKK